MAAIGRRHPWQYYVLTRPFAPSAPINATAGSVSVSADAYGPTVSVTQPTGGLITFVAVDSGNDNTNAASYSITPLPSGTTVGDLAILTIAHPGTSSGSIVFSGWTLAYEAVDSTLTRGSVHYRIVQAGDSDTSAFTFDPPGSATGISWVCCEYSGIDAVNPFAVQSGTISTSDADHVIATPTLANSVSPYAWWVSGGACSDTSGGDSSTDFTADVGIERGEAIASEGVSFHSAVMYDSNASIGAAGSNVVVTYTQNNTTGTPDLIAWLGIINPSPLGMSVVNPYAAQVRASYW